MDEINQVQDALNIEDENMKQLPSMLNVLTILTYIGSAFGFLGGIYSYFTICKSVAAFDNIDTSDLGSGFASKMISGAMELVNKQCEHRVVILVITIICSALCFFGAMQMRNLKKQGFIIYSVGELVLPIATIIILGSSALGGMMLVALIVPIIFLILYASQYKQLKN